MTLMSLIGSIIDGVGVLVTFASSNIGSANVKGIVKLPDASVPLHDEVMRGVNPRTL